MSLYTPPYWWWEGILSPELCNLIIREGDQLVSGDGRIGGSTGNSQGGPGTVAPEIRDTNIAFFPQSHWVEGLCTHYAMLANRLSGWNFIINEAQPVQFARYFPEQHYKPHRDDTVRTDLPVMRKLSVAIQLTDPLDYDGGGFLMETSDDAPLENLINFRTRGSVLVFPSTTKHGVAPVTDGVRHSLVCWITGPNFR